MRLRPLALLIAIVACLAPFARADAPPQAAPATQPAARKVTFFATWASTYGKMKFWPTADGVAGSYGITGVDGALHGHLDPAGTKLTFQYVENSGAKGEGWFQLAADGRTFAGKWRVAGAADWQDWAGKLLPPPDTFAGLWRTSYGPMRIALDGRTARGSYQYGRGASIAGQVDGRTLKFTYEETGGAKGEGTLTLADDGQSFAGTWKQTAGPGPQNAGGSWVGSRAVPKENVVYLVVLEARWERGMEASEYTYGEMLRAFFTRVPWVQFRHRFITDESSVRRWCDDVKYIPEPVVLYFSSHGNKDGVVCDGKTIPAPVLIDCVKDLDLKLLHFGACEILAGDVPKKIQEATNARFPISGFTNPADWGGSAVIDFAYLDLVLARGMSPASAVAQTRKMISFAREQAAPGDAISGAGLVIVDTKK